MKWYLDSKTVIVNLIFLAITSYEMYAQFILQLFGPRVYAGFMILCTLVNLYLRKKTDTAITFSKAESNGISNES